MRLFDRLRLTTILCGLAVPLTAQAGPTSDVEKAAKQAVASTVHVRFETNCQEASSGPEALFKSPYDAAARSGNDKAHQQAIADLLRRVNAARAKQLRVGSGTVVSAEGLIVTCSQGTLPENIKVQLADGRELPALARVHDEDSGLLLLELDAKDLPPKLALAQDDAMLGRSVLAAGCDGEDISVSLGIVSGLNRQVGECSTGLTQTDVALSDGGAGGPLVDLEGRLVGIMTVRQADRGPAYAVPASRVRKLLQTRQKDKTVVLKRGWLGIALGSTEVEGKRHVIVNAPLPDGPAQHVGIKKGDVIVKIDGTQVHSAKEVVREIGEKTVGSKVELLLRRDGKEITLAPTLADRPASLKASDTSKAATSAAAKAVADAWTAQTLVQQRQKAIDNLRTKLELVLPETIVAHSADGTLQWQTENGNKVVVIDSKRGPQPAQVQVTRSGLDVKVDTLTKEVGSLRQEIKSLEKTLQALQATLQTQKK